MRDGEWGEVTKGRLNGMDLHCTPWNVSLSFLQNWISQQVRLYLLCVQLSRINWRGKGRMEKRR